MPSPTPRRIRIRPATSDALGQGLGLASATLLLEATARGLLVHQMIGILRDKARELYCIPEGVQPTTGLAIGYAADPNTLPEKYRERFFVQFRPLPTAVSRRSFRHPQLGFRFVPCNPPSDPQLNIVAILNVWVCHKLPARHNICRLVLIRRF